MPHEEFGLNYHQENALRFIMSKLTRGQPGQVSEANDDGLGHFENQNKGGEQTKQCQVYDFGDQKFYSPEEVQQESSIILKFSAFPSKQAIFDHEKYLDVNGNSTKMIECPNQPNFRYDYSDVTSTATIRWDTVCDQAYQQTFDTQSFMIGKLLGAFIFGGISDAIGRFKTYFMALILQATDPQTVHWLSVTDGPVGRSLI